jgi:esterase/lipase
MMVLMVFDQTKFKSGIVSEFGLPDKSNGKTVIICDGAPSIPYKRKLVKFLVKRGFSVFHIRYRGSWESEGEFLHVSPDRDVIETLNSLSGSFNGLWSKEEYSVESKETIVMCSSFGGPAGILAASDPRISKVIAVCPVVDWNEQNEKAESIEEFVHQITFGYPGAYRTLEQNWNKLGKDGFYNPVSQETSISGEKILIVQTTDDDTVLYGPVKEFADRVGANILTLKKGGHIGAGKLLKWRIWRKVNKFIFKN